MREAGERAWARAPALQKQETKLDKTKHGQRESSQAEQPGFLERSRMVSCVQVAPRPFPKIKVPLPTFLHPESVGKVSPDAHTVTSEALWNSPANALPLHSR